MALRNLAARWRAMESGYPALVRAASNAPSVYDKMIDITVIDKVGRRHTLRGLEGQTLVELLEAHTDTLGEDAVAPSPDGRSAPEAHVKVPNEILQQMPAPTQDQAQALSQVADSFDVDQHSRLASTIVLSPSLSGTSVALGHHYPWKSL